MNFRRWVVFSFVIHFLVIAVDKAGGAILWWLTQERKEEKGAADLVTTLPFILTAVANLGLATSLVYFIRRKKYGLKEVSQTVSMVAVVWGGAVALMAMGVCAFLLPAIEPAWQITPWIYVPVCLCVPFQLVSSYFNSIQLATDRVRDYNLVHLATASSFLPLFLVFYFTSGESAARGIADARLVSAVTITVLTLWMLRGIVSFRPRLHSAFLRDGLAFGWKANATSVLTYLNHRLDLFMIPLVFVGVAGLSGRELVKEAAGQVALYSWAVTFAELVWHFPEATRDLFFSKVASVTHEEARKLTPTLARLSLVVAILGSAAIYLTIDPVLHWATITFKGKPTWRVDWAPTVMPALLVLMPGTITFTLAKILQNDLAGRGHLGACIWACLVNLVTMVGLDLLWIPKEGALGAARASSISFVVSSVYTLWAYQSAGGAKWWQCVVPHVSDWRYVREIMDAVLVKLRLRKIAT